MQSFYKLMQMTWRPTTEGKAESVRGVSDSSIGSFSHETVQKKNPKMQTATIVLRTNG